MGTFSPQCRYTASLLFLAQVLSLWRNIRLIEHPPKACTPQALSALKSTSRWQQHNMQPDKTPNFEHCSHIIITFQIDSYTVFSFLFFLNTSRKNKQKTPPSYILFTSSIFSFFCLFVFYCFLSAFQLHFFATSSTLKLFDKLHEDSEGIEGAGRIKIFDWPIQCQ